MFKTAFFLAAFSGLISASLTGPLSAEAYTEQSPAKVHMVVWRGCEEACNAFRRFFESRALPVEVEVTDVAKDRAVLPEIQNSLKTQRPDLVITWGTSVTRGILGTQKDYGQASALGDIPALFMIVADPVGSDIVASYEETGRDNISGVRNRVPEDVQLKLLFEFYRPSALGLVNDPNELNSQLNTKSLKAISGDLALKVIPELYSTDGDGNIDPEQIPAALARLKDRGAEAIYVGSSSFNLEHRDIFVEAATDLELPVFSAYTQMVRESGALMAVGTSYANVGSLAAAQAEKVLFKARDPGALPVQSLNRFSVILNMKTATKLEIYPPLSLLSMAEVVQ